MVSRLGGSWAVIKKVSRALILFIIIAVVFPLCFGAVYGVPAGNILSMVVSTAIFQAAAPPIGLAMGLTPLTIVITMAFFAIGMVVAILELCGSLAMSSGRVQQWIDKVGKKMEKYPAIKKYGAVSCIAIAWIPGIGLYGTPIIAWILGWKRLPTILFTTLGFVIATIFVLFFANRIEIERILLLLVVAIIAGIAIMLIRKYVLKKKNK